MLFNNNNQSSFFLEKFTKRIHQIFTGVSRDTLDANTVNTLKQAKPTLDNQYSSNPNSNLDISKTLFEDGLAEASTKSPMLRKSDSKKDLSSNFKRNFSSILTTNKSNLKNSGTRMPRVSESSKQQVVSITYEEIGLFPRSFNRVFDRFFKQLFFDVENLVIQEYRFYRYLFLTTVKCMFLLIFVPLTINFIAKNSFVRPITQYYWNTHQPEIFLNSYQQKRAFTELQDFEEKIYFESLILSNPIQSNNLNVYSKNKVVEVVPEASTKKPADREKLTDFNSKHQENSNRSLVRSPNMLNNTVNNTGIEVTDQSKILEKAQYDQQIPFEMSYLRLQGAYPTEFFSESVQNRLHDKILQLAVHYNEESIEAITNFFADFISFSSLCYLFFALEIQINITKSFLLEVFFGLDDSKKSLFILFLTDLLVGYHSPNIWELFFSSLFDHYGLPESQTTIFLLVATLPVLLDVLFKYLIFRHLNRASPATVATYHAMIE